MKKLYIPRLVLALLGLVSTVSLAAQNATIIGPNSLCLGECGTYEVVLSDSSFFIETVAWGDATGAVIGNSNPTVYCPSTSITGGTTVLFVNGFAFGPNGNTFQFSTEITITVSSSLDLTIVPTIASCPQDSSTAPSACEKICAFGTAVYEVTGVSAGTNITWSVQGAESFTPNGSTVLVEWGAPGQGQVTVVANGSGVPSGQFQIFCGQQSLGNNPNTPAQVYINELYGIAPYTIAYSINGVQQAPLTNANLPISLPAAQPGTYAFTVTDANGQSDFCSTIVVNSSQNCWVSVYPSNITPPSDPFSCDGSLEPTVVGGFPPYTYLWSNGTTIPEIDGVCCGTYTITVVDGIGCSATTPIIVSCTDTLPGCFGETSLCVEILEEPEAQIGSLPPPQPNGPIAICQGQTVYFQNNSTNATSYVWDLGNGTTSTQFEPSQAYNTPGTYYVSLIARNECYCADTTTVEVYVIAAEVPSISCTGTICEGETVTYSTDANCSSYTWAITGSYNVLDGGGPSDNFITVEWLAGPEGSISLTVGGCAGAVCNLPNVVPIPIVSDNVQIQGPPKVCEGSTEEYFIPNYQGTSINWTVLGSGNIVDGQGTERITVNWYGSANFGNPQRVIVEFDNCYLGCSGRDTLNVNIVPGFYTTGPIEVCQNSNGTYQSRNSINDILMLSNWQVINSSGTVVWSSPSATNTANIPFNFPAGAYTVRATAASASSFCNDEYSLFIKLVAAPPAPTAITGEDEICPGLAYPYEATGLPTADFSWTFTGGTPTSFNGNPANVTWNATGPYTISVVQTATTGLACTSAATTLTVMQIPSFSVTGDGQVCLEETGIYNAPFFESVDYDWVISPATAGTIINGANTEQVEVLWHTAGQASIGVTICGASQSYGVTVLPLPQPVAQAPAELCAGETVAVQTTVPYASYSWNDANGFQLSTLPSPTFGAGNYEVEVTDANGCVGDTIFEIIEHQFPPISLTIPPYQPICPGGPPVTIYSVVTSAGGYNYQWFLNGNPIGGNVPDLVATQGGLYSLVVTDGFGCTVSDSRNVLDCATIGGTCVNGTCTIPAGGCGDCTICPCLPACTTNGVIDFTYSQTSNCNIFNFTNTSTNFIPGSLSWNFGDPGSGTANSSTQTNPSHTFSNVGYFTVVLEGLVNDLNNPGFGCPAYAYYTLLVPLKANFEATAACPGAPVNFSDRSVWVTGANITAWSWDFDDPSSGAANSSSLQNPTHVFSAPGTYNVTLTITETSGCTVSTTLPVTVFTPPAVSFALPTATCENTSLPFDAIVGTQVASVYWNFGDPASGDGNTSELTNSFHEFDAPGSYAVQLTALSVEGCTNTYSNNMVITPNNLSGNIDVTPPSPLCEGETTTLTAPLGGTSWLWSNNFISNNIIVSESGVYTVTLTDATGCTYSPPPALVDVFGEPNGIIKAVEYNEFGQPVAFYENSHSVCAGDDVSLTIQGSLNYSYTWSDGSTADELEFSEDKGNLLPVGTHVFTVTVTDNTTGCTATEGPFTVTVNPLPTVAISSIPAGFICENTSATMSIIGPNPNNTYQWNTGEIGTSITVIAGGIYFATAINQFGCKEQSNEIEIHNAPDIDLVPQGCHTRCQPDTMCLPIVPEIASYQWYWNGSPMPAPNGTQANPIFNQSGEYSVVMTDIYGCTSTSDPLTLDLFPGFGDIVGNVWFDVNGNGIIDGPDTLVSGIDIILNDGTANIDTATSTTSTGYNFVDILSTNYTLLLDLADLPLGWSAIQSLAAITLSGCDVEEDFDWLLFINCTTTTASVTLNACPGSTADYNGTPVPTGTTQEVILVNYLGCDSVVTVTVNPFPTSTGSENFDACQGTSITYNGTQVAAGSSQDFTFPNWQGCDSVVTVTVNALPTPTGSEQLTACPGEFASYNGTPLAPGTTTDFFFPSSQNCDSVVTVTVSALTASASTVDLSACPGTFANYNGTNILAGTSQDFTLNNWLNCDSVVTVAVANLPAGTLFVDGATCAGEFFNYNGNQVPAGTTQIFYETNNSGCTDTIVVAVVAVPTSNSNLQLIACPGTTVSYNGMTLSPGDTEIFTFTNWLNCDSVVTVTVVGAQSDTTYLSLDVCNNETVNYAGQTLAAGEQYTWFGTNQAGCDSVVYVSVNGLPAVSFDLAASQICWNAVNGSISVGNIVGSTSPYQFSLNGTNFQTDTLFTDLLPGSYTVFLQDQNNCLFQQTIALPVTPQITVQVEDKTLVCGTEVLLNPLVISDLPLTWEWQDSSGILSTNAEITVGTPGIYTFTVTNDCETAVGQVQVTAEELRQSRLIYLPNSFSPNDDGINDCYRGYVAPDLDIISYELKLFDRWGELLFETTDIEGCWDGLLRGRHMNPGVVVYWMRLTARNCDGVETGIFRKGDIHLVR